MLGERLPRADAPAPRFRAAQAGVMQFKDLNADKSAFQRTYANQACTRKRCLRAAHPQLQRLADA